MLSMVLKAGLGRLLREQTKKMLRITYAFVTIVAFRFVNWSGTVMIGGLITETLNILKLKGNYVISEERIPLHRRIRDIIQAPDGAVWVLTDEVNGELLRISPASH